MTGETAATIEGRPSTRDTGTDTRIQHGTPAFRRTALALFLAGFSTFGLLNSGSSGCPSSAATSVCPRPAARCRCR
jgi:hypothetical protein